MFEDAIAKDGTLDSLLLDELYYEALDLSELVVDYFQRNKKESFQHLGVELMGFYTLECNRVTSGIMASMSWCLMQKGVRSGEVSVEEAAKEKSRLSNVDLFEMPLGCDETKLPSDFITYSKRARALYDKIVRLDRILYELEKGEENPIHNLIDKIEKI